MLILLLTAISVIIYMANGKMMCHLLHTWTNPNKPHQLKSKSDPCKKNKHNNLFTASRLSLIPHLFPSSIPWISLDREWMSCLGRRRTRVCWLGQVVSRSRVGQVRGRIDLQNSIPKLMGSTRVEDERAGWPSWALMAWVWVLQRTTEEMIDKVNRDKRK